MSHIIQLKQRIKAVETIQKTTHAMRLTSMSTHARLIKQKEALNRYKQEIETLINQLRIEINKKETPEEHSQQANRLTIIIGSQKGLCGAFNTRLIRYFYDTIVPKYGESPTIAIGKKVIDLLNKDQTLLYQYPSLTPTNLFGLVGELSHHILGKAKYTHIMIIANHPQSFFNQKPSVSHITPPSKHLPHNANYSQIAELCDPDPKKILTYLEEMYLKSQLETLFFNSLVAEYSARFLSMDSSTNNAEKLLTSMQRDYNKLRQANITNELMDLMGGMI